MLRDVLIRPTAEADLVAVTAIYSEAVSTDLGSYELAAPDVPMMTRRWRNRIAKGYPHIVATSGNAVIGYAFVRNARASAACDFVIEDGIYVASHAQGAGVGRALLEELLKICEALKFRQVIAVIADENVSSVRLHEYCGFRVVGLIEGSAFKNGRWIDSLLLQRALGDGNASSPSHR